jgi:hypothetical protein
MDQISGTDIQEIEISCFEPKESTPALRSDFTSALTPDSDLFQTLTERKNYHLELNLSDERHSLPLILRKSNIYKSTSIAIIDNYRAFASLQNLIQEWFLENPKITTSEHFQVTEKKHLVNLGTPVFKPGYLLIFIRKKTYLRLSISIYDNIVR